MSYDPDEPPSAFLQAKAGFELFGSPLRPFSASRKVAAQSMGVLYPAIGEEGFEQFTRCGTYPGMLKDVFCTLWLATLPDAREVHGKEWTPSRALQKPREAVEAALEWADGAGIVDLQGAPFAEAAPVALAILQGIEASRFYLKEQGSDTAQEPAGNDSPARMNGQSTSDKCGPSQDSAETMHGTEYPSPRDFTTV